MMEYAINHILIELFQSQLDRDGNSPLHEVGEYIFQTRNG